MASGGPVADLRISSDPLTALLEQQDTLTLRVWSTGEEEGEAFAFRFGLLHASF